jgi:hypothetical protein
MFSVLSHILYSILNFLFALFFIMLGILGILLPFSASVRIDLIEFLLENSIAIGLFGFGFVIVGATMLGNLYLNSRRKCLYVSNNPVTAIDEAVLYHYLDAYWKQTFPKEVVPTRLQLRKNRIKIFADLPYTVPEEQSSSIKRIEQDLQDIFKRILGYSQEFILSLTFAKKSKKP